MPRRTLVLGMLVILSLSACSRPDSESNSETPAQEEEAAGEMIVTGKFVDKGGQATSGSFTLERVGTDLRLALSDDFRTDDGPDLHVVLTPTTVAEAGNDNAMVEGAQIVGELASLAGGQVYDLPDDLQWDQYNSVAIHCIEFSHLYGAAPLR